MNDTNGVLTQGSQVETSKTRVKPIGGSFGFFSESFEADEERVTPIPDFVNKAFESQEFDPTATSASCLQGPGSIDFNTPKETRGNESDHHLDPTASIFSTPQIIAESPVNMFNMLGGTTEKLAEGAGKIIETVGSVVETGKKTLETAGNTIVKDLILEEMFGVKLQAQEPANTNRPLSEKEQEELRTGQFIKLRGEGLQAELSQAEHETKVKVAVGMIGKPELTDEDSAMLGDNPNLRREQRNNIYNFAVLRGKIAEKQKEIAKAETAAETQQVQGTVGKGFTMGEGEMQKAGEQGPNHPIKATG